MASAVSVAACEGYSLQVTLPSGALVGLQECSQHLHYQSEGVPNMQHMQRPACLIPHLSMHADVSAPRQLLASQGEQFTNATAASVVMTVRLTASLELWGTGYALAACGS